MDEKKTEINVVSVNISKKKGTVKHPIDHIQLDNMGIVGDAHAGSWHRQVSMLAKESINEFEKLAGRHINNGEFAENITTEGLLLYKVSPLDRFVSDSIELEVTQIGKECHGDSCAIFREIGNCVMPKEGIFCRVIRQGQLKPGEILRYEPKIFRSLIVTLSDRASRGEYEDKSGPKLKELLQAFFNKIKWHNDIKMRIIPDDAEMLESILKEAKENNTDFIFTTGGTGIGPKDITPDVVKSMLDKEIPGIMDFIRLKYGQEKPNALISRGVAGIIGRSFIFTLPGSIRAVEEYMNEITKSLMHLVYMLHEIDTH